ncbi:nuclease-related domain-containing protein [Streptomyces sp. NPDC088725]|uniref:nuclease-related domain-containing protein n=1 Tax=Streptomyces sp. NPDC088725 TaxID=3365873 RepID=UPI003804CB5A
MTGPRLRVTAARWYGPERLYVTRVDGASVVAWYDKETARVSLLPGAARDEVLAALAPYVTGEVTVGPPPVPTAADLARLSLHPDDDLAPNRPGEALHAELEESEGPDASRQYPRGLRRGSRRPDEGPRDALLAAHQAVGEQLDRFEGAGWRVVHAISPPGATATAIDHLVIGPAGVFAVHTLAAGRKRVRIADPLVRTGRGEPLPHLRRARRAAEHASLALATAVRPVLVVVEASRLDVGPPSRGRTASPDGPALTPVRILHDTEIQALTALTGVLKPADVESLYATARDRRTWTRL